MGSGAEGDDAGCMDIDVESSAMTNGLPVWRLQLPVGTRSDAPAAYVRVGGLSVERLEQRYRRDHPAAI